MRIAKARRRALPKPIATLKAAFESAQCSAARACHQRYAARARVPSLWKHTALLCYLVAELCYLVAELLLLRLKFGNLH